MELLCESLRYIIKFLSIVTVVCCLVMFNGEAFAKGNGGGGSARGSLGVMTESAGETPVKWFFFLKGPFSKASPLQA